MKQRLSDKISCMLAYVFILLAIGFVFTGLITPDSKYTAQENRYLAQRPPLSWNAILSGEWGNSFEAYCLDQVMFRKNILKGYFGFLDDVGVMERDGYVHGEQDTFLNVQTIKSGSDIQGRAERYTARVTEMMPGLQRVCEESGAHLISLQIPYKNEFYMENYPSLYADNTGDWLVKQEYVVRQLKEDGIDVVDTTPVLLQHSDEYLYFYTDNHYTYRGAHYVYKELLKHINETYGEKLYFPDWDECEYVKEPRRFVGTYLRDFGDSGRIDKDFLEYIIPHDMPDYRRIEEGVETDNPIFDTRAADYSRFMSGDHGNTVLLTDRPQLPNVLYIGWSYTNALECLSAYSFNEIHSLDPRHYSGSLSEYIREHDIQYVIVVRNDLDTENKKNIAQID